LWGQLHEVSGVKDGHSWTSDYRVCVCFCGVGGGFVVVVVGCNFETIATNAQNFKFLIVVSCFAEVLLNK